MIVTAFLLYLAAIHGLEITSAILLATFLVDAIAWSSIKDVFSDGESDPLISMEAEKKE